MIQRPSPLPPHPLQQHLPLDRRRLLRGSGLAAVALGGTGLLAACSGDPAEPGPGSAPSGDGTTAPSASTDSPSTDSPSTDSPSTDSPSTDESSGDGADAPDGFEVDPASVPVGGGLILTDSDFVVTQPSQGEFRAFDKICPHQGCPVSEVADAEIVCFCHGSAFSIEDGSVIQGPAEQGLGAAEVTDQGGRLYIS